MERQFSYISWEPSIFEEAWPSYDMSIKVLLFCRPVAFTGLGSQSYVEIQTKTFHSTEFQWAVRFSSREKHTLINLRGTFLKHKVRICFHIPSSSKTIFTFILVSFMASDTVYHFNGLVMFHTIVFPSESVSCMLAHAFIRARKFPCYFHILQYWCTAKYGNNMRNCRL